MPRIKPIELEQADSATAATLKAMKARFGKLPNLFTTVACSPAALNGYLQMSEALSRGRLTERQREIIAIAVALENASEYCLSAHVTMGKGAGLNDDEILKAQQGAAFDAADDLVTDFALQVMRNRADVSDVRLKALKKAGLDDELIMEILLHLAMNVFTNYVNKIAGTEVDFPRVPLTSAA